MQYCVTLDPADSSVTFSELLCAALGLSELKDRAEVMVFRLKDGSRDRQRYAFVINPPFTAKETQLAEIQYNAQHGTTGFETLVPTVGRILYDYGLPALEPVSLLVQVGRMMADGNVYIEILNDPV